MTHCCQAMIQQISYQCEQHESKFDCPDQLVSYNEKFDEYSLIIHDGGSSILRIHFCPWCGATLPESKRDRWFNELEAKGFDNPFDDEIPPEYKTGEWYLLNRFIN